MAKIPSMIESNIIQQRNIKEDGNSAYGLYEDDEIKFSSQTKVPEIEKEWQPNKLEQGNIGETLKKHAHLMINQQQQELIDDISRQRSRKEPFGSEAQTRDVDLIDIAVDIDKNKLLKPPIFRTVIEHDAICTDADHKPPTLVIEERPTKYANDFVLILLDEHLHTISNHYFEHHVGLEKIIKFFEKFHNLEHCINYLKTLSQKQIYLIISSILSNKIDITIDRFPQIIRIYLFTAQNIRNLSIKNSAMVFHKHMKENERGYSKDFLPLNFVCKNEQMSMLNDIESHFGDFLLLQSILMSLKNTDRGRQDMITYLNFFCNNEPRYLEEIAECDKTYKPKDAINWYTRTSFMYRTLNTTCRTQNIECMFQLRYYMNDLNQQITNEFQELKDVIDERYIFYRGKVMYLEELEELKSCEGKYILTKTFLSVTLMRDVADIYAGASAHLEDGQVSVVYKIEVETDHSKPFALVRDKTAIKDDDELLFIINMFFKIISVKEIKDNCWEIHVRRDKEVAEEEKQILDCIQAQNQQTDPFKIAAHLTQIQIDNKLPMKISSRPIIQELPKTNFTYENVKELLNEDSSLMSTSTVRTCRMSGSSKRAMVELKKLEIKPPLLQLKTEDRIWHVLLEGPQSTPYENGKFWIKIEFAKAYPFKPPHVNMTTPVYHLNIDKTGKLCIHILGDGFSPAISMQTIIHEWYSVFKDPLIDDANLAALYQSNYTEYCTNARKWTERYAMGE
ncbi:unnamed protein product [Didymodactylos carnosus]|uniref:UBC core domain-containing protein n=1 Tax=Didymodactylos carnosus TaxID=1234261 RepID=A0A815BPX1_9BILA|nr:unnamed protein product [Didymodactylos carnosus]CAF4063067.1 unnamed protein product [Didymodactylos carnosus]